MSDNIPYYGGRTGNKTVSDFYYGRFTYGTVEEEEEGVPLPPINYNDAAYDEWSLRVCLKAQGVAEQDWGIYLCLKDGAVEYKYGYDRVYKTLLYRVVLSNNLHDRFDRIVYHLMAGFLREIWNENEMGMVLTSPLLRSISIEAAWYISCSFMEYAIIYLDLGGYYENRSSDSDRELVD